MAWDAGVPVGYRGRQRGLRPVASRQRGGPARGGGGGGGGGDEAAGEEANNGHDDESTGTLGNRPVRQVPAATGVTLRLPGPGGAVTGLHPPSVGSTDRRAAGRSSPSARRIRRPGRVRRSPPR